MASADAAVHARVVGTHQDSPHIELKGRPIYPAGGFALFKTKYYGGIKKYQWANIPLALVGRIDTADGRTIDVSVGLNNGEPVFVIPDSAPHSDVDLRTRTYTNVLQGEELDPVIGSVPGEKESVAVEVTQLLTSTYKIKEEDLVSAELALVPAAHPADVVLGRRGLCLRLVRGCKTNIGQAQMTSTLTTINALMQWLNQTFGLRLPLLPLSGWPNWCQAVMKLPS